MLVVLVMVRPECRLVFEIRAESDYGSLPIELFSAVGGEKIEEVL